MAILKQWDELIEMDQLDKAIEESYNEPVVLFKHSVTCGISAAAKHRLEKEFDQIDSLVHFYYLDLLKYRPISNEIAKRLNVIHQSPQTIVLKDGKVIHSASHSAIHASKIAGAISINNKK